MEIVIPETTLWDMDGGTVILTLKELMPIPATRRRTVIMERVKHYVEDRVWAAQRLDVTCRYRVLTTLTISDLQVQKPDRNRLGNQETNAS